uniref:Uncharacterized protein n=1 Tax=Rhizophora mucronata TaxID=61149 RepID=A0A2P2QBT3_RHIMU
MDSKMISESLVFCTYRDGWSDGTSTEHFLHRMLEKLSQELLGEDQRQQGHVLEK